MMPSYRFLTGNALGSAGSLTHSAPPTTTHWQLLLPERRHCPLMSEVIQFFYMSKTHLPETVNQNSGLNKLISLLYLAGARIIIFSSNQYTQMEAENICIVLTYQITSHHFIIMIIQ